MLIDQIYRIVGIATDKGLTGYHSPDEVMRELHAAQMDLYNDLIRENAFTQQIADLLSPFVIPKMEVALSNGAGVVPQVIEHPALAVSAKDRNAEIVTLAEWAYVTTDPISPPSADNVKVLFENQGPDRKYRIAVAPTSEAKVYIYGYRLPAQPVFGVTIQNGRQVFDPTTSTDIEWSPLMHNRLRDAVLVKLGINLREYNTVAVVKQ